MIPRLNGLLFLTYSPSEVIYIADRPLFTHDSFSYQEWHLRLSKLRVLLVLLGQLVILFNGPPKPEAYCSGWSQELCEELILTVGFEND